MSRMQALKKGDKELDLLTLAEVAEIARAPLASVRFWCSSRRLRSFRVGRRRLVERRDLVDFIESGANR